MLADLLFLESAPFVISSWACFYFLPQICLAVFGSLNGGACMDGEFW